MSLINTQVQPFKANAFHNGKFIEVTEKDLQGQVVGPDLHAGRLHLQLPDRDRRRRRALRRVPEGRRRGLHRHHRHPLLAQGVARNLAGRRQGQVPAGRRPDPRADQRLRRAHPGRRPGPARHLRDQPGRHDQDDGNPRQRHRPRRQRNRCASSRPPSTSPATRARSARPSGRKAPRPSPRRWTWSARSDSGTRTLFRKGEGCAEPMPAPAPRNPLDRPFRARPRAQRQRLPESRPPQETAMLDAALKTQLAAYLEKLQQPIELVASLDDFRRRARTR